MNDKTPNDIMKQFDELLSYLMFYPPIVKNEISTSELTIYFIGLICILNREHLSTEEIIDKTAQTIRDNPFMTQKRESK